MVWSTNGEKMTIYAPNAFRQKVKDFALKHHVSVSHFMIYATLEAMENIEKREAENVGIFDFKSLMKEKIKGYYTNYIEVKKWSKK